MVGGGAEGAGEGVVAAGGEAVGAVALGGGASEAVELGAPTHLLLDRVAPGLPLVASLHTAALMSGRFECLQDAVADLLRLLALSESVAPVGQRLEGCVGWAHENWGPHVAAAYACLVLDGCSKLMVVCLGAKLVRALAGCSGGFAGGSNGSSGGGSLQLQLRCPALWAALESQVGWLQQQARCGGGTGSSRLRSDKPYDSVTGARRRGLTIVTNGIIDMQ